MIVPDYREIKHQNEIYHYGIKRRSGRYPWGSGDRPYQSVKNALKGKSRSEYFTSERTIPKGTMMYRTTSNQLDDLKNGKSTYVTYLDTDRDLYKGGHIRLRDQSDRAYEHTMVLDKDLKIPSRETFKETINESIKQNPKLLKESVESYLNELIPEKTWDRYQIETDPNTGKINKKLWDNFVNESYLYRMNQPIEEQWGSIAMSFGKADSLKKDVIDRLKKEGYNAMVDEAGVGGSGRAVEGIDPLIIFDSSILKPSKTSEISKSEEQKSKKNYNKWRAKAGASGRRNEW